jgi:FAD binding domain
MQRLVHVFVVSLFKGTLLLLTAAAMVVPWLRAQAWRSGRARQNRLRQGDAHETRRRFQMSTSPGTCCIAGGGPAGMMLGFLLARAGIEVVVLEKHADFLRDFRGDTVHPSTLEVMHELGLLEQFLKRLIRRAAGSVRGSEARRLC